MLSKQIAKYITLVLLIFTVPLVGCENTDVMMAVDAGLDAAKAISLSSEDIVQLAQESSLATDSQHQIAPPGNKYARRLKRLTAEYEHLDGMKFNYKVYISDTVNAFAMADGTIRIYSKLMDMFEDDELRFVIGHEVGHVVKQHIKMKIKLAYAAKAVRKGVASQRSEVGAIAASQIGGFVESLLGAQFSQLEEKEADDYGLTFLNNKGYKPEAAVRALKKLATLGNNHSFLSSHPAPAKRAMRLEQQLAGKALSIEENKQNFMDKIKTFYEKYILAVFDLVKEFLPV